ncbi:uncharacterized protein LOC115884907 [Sitophilus oryzae]|uniref:Uncharacterized protein LOC115884907 n=1 Tax=Sitophilus oryzae TaxID=7048 RepID=A0A6J2Y8K9_SITOR|nr:uncharacterized protein LOC115884907 [Sitophilus oryzae]
MAMHYWDKRTKGATNEHLRKVYNIPVQTPKSRGEVRRHNCLSSETKSEGYLRGQASNSRPITRRNPTVTPNETLPTRSFSAGSSRRNEKMFRIRHKKRVSLSSTKSNDTEIENITEKQEELDCSEKEVHQKVHNPKMDDKKDVEAISSRSFLKTSTEDHQYLLFLLRITEDIIVNDFYSNNDIKQVFRLHIEANKQRLDLQKMRFHISNLCKELNLTCPEYELPPKTEADLNTSKPHALYLNNQAFRNCDECSMLRSSSLHKIHSLGNQFMGGDGPLQENDAENNIAVSPSLLKVLEKLSLSRVSECTEPVPSTSTVDSPHTKDESKNCRDFEITPLLDFDAFVEKLNSNEVIAENLEIENVSSTHFPKLETPSRESNVTITQENQTAPSKDSNITIIPENGTEFLENLSNITSTPKLETSKTVVVEFKPVEDEIIELPEEPKPPIAKTISNSTQKEICDTGRTSSNKPESVVSVTVQSIESHTSKKDSAIIIEKNDKKPENDDINDEHSVNCLYLNVNLCKDSEKEILLSGRSSNVPDQNSSLKSISLSPSLVQCPTLPEIPTESNQEETSIQIILKGNFKDEDFVMIKGPVYILKALLDTQPPLVIFNKGSNENTQRRSSVQSEASNASHRTFTMDSSHHEGVPVIDPIGDAGFAFDFNLHSLDDENSIENILELTRRTYRQFIDSKLLNSDYDLTPQKDDNDNKYHHLLVDASSSVSGVNLAENLLLSNDYLVKNNSKTSSVQVNEESAKNIENYARPEPKQVKIRESNYVNRFGALSNQNVPNVIRNDKFILNVPQVKTIETVDVASQDSSLVSEGETAINYQAVLDQLNKYCK